MKKDSDYEPCRFRCIFSGFEHVLIFIKIGQRGSGQAGKFLSEHFSTKSLNNSIEEKFNLKFDLRKFQHENTLWYISTIYFPQQRTFRVEILYMHLLFRKLLMIIQSSFYLLLLFENKILQLNNINVLWYYFIDKISYILISFPCKCKKCLMKI